MRPSARSALLVLALCAVPAATAGGCTDHFILHGDPEKQTPSDEDWRETEALEAPSVDVLWNHVLAVLEADGHPADDQASDYARREIVTRWNASLGTIRYEGRRTRVHARLVDAGGGKWIVRVAVLRQTNTDIKDPTDPLRAKWERDAADVNRAALLVWKIQAAYAAETDETDAVPDAPTRR